MIALLVAVGAAVGAPARYLTDRAVQSRHTTRFPLGTFTVNVTASFVLGLVTGAAAHLSDGTEALLGVGFCGALSTFSTFSWEVLQLGRRGTRLVATATAVLSIVATVGVAALGWWLAALA